MMRRAIFRSLPHASIASQSNLLGHLMRNAKPFSSLPEIDGVSRNDIRDIGDKLKSIQIRLNDVCNIKNRLSNIEAKLSKNDVRDIEIRLKALKPN